MEVGQAQRSARTVTKAKQQKQLGLHRTLPGVAGPVIGPGGYPLEAGLPGSLRGLDAARPQVNATNQSALAPNGTINQTVTNENTYNNTYNVVGGGTYPGYAYSQPWMGAYGAGMGAPYGGWDTWQGAGMCGQRGGIAGWFQRLFRGY